MLKSFLVAAALSTVLTCGFLKESAKAEPVRLSLSKISENPGLQSELTGNGRNALQLTITNQGAETIEVELPAGIVCSGKSTTARVITLRASSLTIPPNGTAEAEIPAAALSLKKQFGPEPFTVTETQEPRLANLLNFLATRDEIPRVTAQLLVLAIMEDVTFANWQHFVAEQRTAPPKDGNDVVLAVDALGVLRELAPNRDFALFRDNELKLRALRNPTCRAKAVQIYGLAGPDVPGDAGGDLPSLKQLLHTQPGDNCPVCKMRQQAGRGAGDF